MKSAREMQTCHMTASTDKNPDTFENEKPKPQGNVKS